MKIGEEVMIQSDITEKEKAIILQSKVFMVIDMQNDAMLMVPSGKEIIPNIKKVLDNSRDNKVPIIHKNRVQRANGIDVERFRVELFEKTPFLVDGTDGAKIVQELEPTKDEIIVKGARFSGFFQTDLHLILSRLGIQTIVMSGIQTPNCIRATVTDAIAYDYDVVLLNDAISAQTPEIHEANLLDMKNMGVSIISTSDYLDIIS
jgi:nicotinamidase-related amidase